MNSCNNCGDSSSNIYKEALVKKADEKPYQLVASGIFNVDSSNIQDLALHSYFFNQAITIHMQYMEDKEVNYESIQNSGICNL